MYKAPEIELTLLELDDILTVSEGDDKDDGKPGNNATEDDELFN